MEPFIAVVCRTEHWIMGYILHPRPGEREAGLAELAAHGEWVVGEFETADEARKALALAMARTEGGRQ